jgi:amidase
MKPTRGRVSMQPAREHWLGLSTFGPLARRVRDSALLLDAMRGITDRDLHVAPPFSGSYAEAAATAPGRLRVAVSRKLPPGMLARLSADQRGAWEQMIELLAELGHEVIERDPAYGTVALVFTQTWLRGIYEDSLEVPDRSKLERSTREVARAGRLLVSERRSRQLRGGESGAGQRPDPGALGRGRRADDPALASPPLAAQAGYGRGGLAAFNLAGRFTPWTPSFNLTGQPAVTIPAGVNADGLPLSVQLVGRLGAEDTLYGLAGQIEEARPWAGRRPPIASAGLAV